MPGRMFFLPFPPDWDGMKQALDGVGTHVAGAA
jgi:hypothetical protein